MLETLKIFRSPKNRWAWLIAVAADVLQFVALPVFGEGVLSAADVALDIAVATALSRLIGWHWAFLPTFLVELAPGLDLFPTWTAAVFSVTRQRTRSHEPEIIPPER